MNLLRSIASLAPLLVLAACSQEPPVHRHAFFALGTLVEISVFSPPEDIDGILRDVEIALLDEEQRWRAWGDGELARLNAGLSAGDAMEIEPAILAGTARARDISARSGHRFNPAMGRAIELWGFHAEERAPGPPPSDAALAELLPPPRLESLVQEDTGRWRSTDSRLWIDMGAFAKGLAVETAVGILREHGIAHAIVNAGGDLKVLGRHGERRWRIGVRHPRGNGVLAALDANDGESVFTSGDYERFFEWNGERQHHILDPATGRPSRGVMSVTVLHSDAALADAAATALFVAGARDWPAVARDLGIDHAMVVLADGRVQLTQAMQARVTFESPPAGTEIVAP